MPRAIERSSFVSPRGGTVQIRLRTDSRRAWIDVIDEGPGVEPAERTRVFESFYQGKRVPEGRVKGSGLGLAIAREYAHAHGGDIEVVDREDGRRGAHFRVSLIADSDAVNRNRDKNKDRQRERQV